MKRESKFETSTDYQLPPGELWWISRCSYIPSITFTFTDIKTPTWVFAKQHADILWREYILTKMLTYDNIARQRMLRNPFRLEEETQKALKLVTTKLWEGE